MTGYKINMITLYTYATLREIFSAFFVAKLLGIISQKSKSKNVIAQVESQIASDCSIPELTAIEIAICVARAAV